jgi:hypothetical protein
MMKPIFAFCKFANVSKNYLTENESELVDMLLLSAHDL